MNDRDPFELIAAANPVPGLTERLPGDDEMLATIMSMPVVPAKRRPRRRTMWLGGGGVVVVGVGLAAFAFVREESSTDPLSMICFSAAEERPAQLYATVLSADLATACGQLWTNGEFASLDEAPPLTACVLETGIVAVMPGTQEVCSRLGLPNWAGEVTTEQSNLQAFQLAIIETFGDQCVGEADAEPRVRELLAQYGLEDWKIVDRGGHTADLPCTNAVVGNEITTVILISRRDTSSG